MEIVLSLKNHCIETAAKKEYERLIQGYFKNKLKGKSWLEVRIEALKYFLERADFSRLRSFYPELCGSVELPIKLKIPEDFQELKIIVKDRTIHPKWKKPDAMDG